MPGPEVVCVMGCDNRVGRFLNKKRAERALALFPYQTLFLHATVGYR